MDTGKVEYAPDYKSGKRIDQVRVPPPDHVTFDRQGRAHADFDRIVNTELARQYPDMADKFKAMELRAEHQRLKDAVVEAVKARRVAELTFDKTSLLGASDLLNAEVSENEAVDAIIAFEKEHNIQQA